MFRLLQISHLHACAKNSVVYIRMLEITDLLSQYKMHMDKTKELLIKTLNYHQTIKYTRHYIKTTNKWKQQIIILKCTTGMPHVKQ
jgi:hypothetical protein